MAPIYFRIAVAVAVAIGVGQAARLGDEQNGMHVRHMKLDTEDEWKPDLAKWEKKMKILGGSLRGALSAAQLIKDDPEQTPEQKVQTLLALCAADRPYQEQLHDADACPEAPVQEGASSFPEPDPEVYARWAKKYKIFGSNRDALAAAIRNDINSGMDDDDKRNLLAAFCKHHEDFKDFSECPEAPVQEEEGSFPEPDPEVYAKWEKTYKIFGSNRDALAAKLRNDIDSGFSEDDKKNLMAAFCKHHADFKDFEECPKAPTKIKPTGGKKEEMQMERSFTPAPRTDVSDIDVWTWLDRTVRLWRVVWDESQSSKAKGEDGNPTGESCLMCRWTEQKTKHESCAYLSRCLDYPQTMMTFDVEVTKAEAELSELMATVPETQEKKSTTQITLERAAKTSRMQASSKKAYLTQKCGNGKEDDKPGLGFCKKLKVVFMDCMRGSLSAIHSCGKAAFTKPENTGKDGEGVVKMEDEEAMTLWCAPTMASLLDSLQYFAVSNWNAQDYGQASPSIGAMTWRHGEAKCKTDPCKEGEEPTLTSIISLTDAVIEDLWNSGPDDREGPGDLLVNLEKKDLHLYGLSISGEQPQPVQQPKGLAAVVKKCSAQFQKLFEEFKVAEDQSEGNFQWLASLEIVELWHGVNEASVEYSGCTNEKFQSQIESALDSKCNQMKATVSEYRLDEILSLYAAWAEARSGAQSDPLFGEMKVKSAKKKVLRPEVGADEAICLLTWELEAREAEFWNLIKLKVETATKYEKEEKEKATKEEKQRMADRKNSGSTEKQQAESVKAYLEEWPKDIACPTNITVEFIKTNSLFESLPDAMSGFEAKDTLLAFDLDGTLERMKHTDSDRTTQILTEGIGKDAEKVVITAAPNQILSSCKTVVFQLEKDGIPPLLTRDHPLTKEACKFYDARDGNTDGKMLSAPGLIMHGYAKADGLVAYMDIEELRKPDRGHPKHVIFLDDFVKNPILFATQFCKIKAPEGLEKLTVVWFDTAAAQEHGEKLEKNYREGTATAKATESSYFIPDAGQDADLAGCRGLFDRGGVTRGVTPGVDEQCSELFMKLFHAFTDESGPAPGTAESLASLSITQVWQGFNEASAEYTGCTDAKFQSEIEGELYSKCNHMQETISAGRREELLDLYMVWLHARSGAAKNPMFGEMKVKSAKKNVLRPEVGAEEAICLWTWASFTGDEEMTSTDLREFRKLVTLKVETVKKYEKELSEKPIIYPVSAIKYRE